VLVSGYADVKEAMLNETILQYLSGNFRRAIASGMAPMIGDYRLAKVDRKQKYGPMQDINHPASITLLVTEWVHTKNGSVICVDLANHLINVGKDFNVNMMRTTNRSIDFGQDPLVVINDIANRRARALDWFVDDQKAIKNNRYFLEILHNVEKRVPKIINAGYTIYGTSDNPSILDMMMETKDECPITCKEAPYVRVRLQCSCKRSSNNTEYFSTHALKEMMTYAKEQKKLICCPHCRKVVKNLGYVIRPPPAVPSYQLIPCLSQSGIVFLKRKICNTIQSDQSDSDQ